MADKEFGVFQKQRVMALVARSSRLGSGPVSFSTQLQKIYGAPSEDEQRRYSPARCIGCDLKVVSGDPDPKHISTSYVERQNLTMRMGMRRFTRLTNGFSKKVDNHRHMVALHYMYYNFCRVHQTLRVTPAMEAKLSDHVWSLEELIVLMPKPIVSASQIEKNMLLVALGSPIQKSSS